VTYVVAILLAALGVVGIVAGGADDSPGLQLLGVLLVVSAVVLAVRAARRRRTGTQRT
jgi:drug/metabolite transporter (DMT)-like permease